MRWGLGLDLGGTKILGVAVSADGAVLAEERVDTPAHGGDHLGALAALIRRLGEQVEGEPRAIGLGAPGPLDVRTGIVYSMPNLTDARDWPLGPELEARIGRRVVLENDANAALLGELAQGAARGQTEALMLTLGTGVGGGLLVAGQVVHGVGGLAAELGHIRVEDQEARPCACGAVGCLETVASGRSVGDLAQAAGLGADARALLALPSETAAPVLARAGRGLGRAIAMLVNTLNPGVCVIGGGFGEAAFARLLPFIQAELEGSIFPRAQTALNIVPAELGERAGALGAAWLALDSQIDGPDS